MSSKQEPPPGSIKLDKKGDSQESDEDLTEEQKIAIIMDLGNQIWHNMGQDEDIEDTTVFFRDQFYI